MRRQPTQNLEISGFRAERPDVPMAASSVTSPMERRMPINSSVFEPGMELNVEAAEALDTMMRSACWLTGVDLRLLSGFRSIWPSRNQIFFEVASERNQTARRASPGVSSTGVLRAQHGLRR